MEYPIAPVATKIFNFFSGDGKDQKRCPTREEIIQRFENQRSRRVRSNNRVATKKKGRAKSRLNIWTLMDRKSNKFQNINQESGLEFFSANSNETIEHSELNTTKENNNGSLIPKKGSRPRGTIIEVKEWDGHSNRYQMNFNTNKLA